MVKIVITSGEEAALVRLRPWLGKGRSTFVKIVQDKRAPNPRRVRIFLAEKGIDVAFENVDIMSEEHKKAHHLAQNPMARLPYLELDDGTVIAETMAICRYFEAVQREPALFGVTPVEIATVEMWNRRVELDLLLPIAHVFRHTHPKMAHLEVPQVPDWAAANRPRVMAMLDFLDRELAARPFLAGKSFTVADITCLCAIDFMKVARLSLGDGHGNLARWHGEVSSRPSARA